MPNRMVRISVAGLGLWFASAQTFADSPKTTDLLNSARDLVARGSFDQAVSLLENGLEETPEADYPAVVGQLRKFYVAAIDQARKAGRLEQADQYAHNLKLMDAASGNVHATAPAAPEPVAQSPSLAIPKARSQNNLHDLNTAPADLPAHTAPPVAKTLETPVVPPVAAESASPKSNVQQFDLAEADNAFRAKKYPEAGAIYQKLMDGNNLPDSRKGHLAYCRCAALVERINRRPTSPGEWTQIQVELTEIKKIQADFWFAEYLSDLVKERQNRLLSSTSSDRNTHLASNDGASGVVGRAASQIRNLNPLRKPAVAK